MIAAAELMVQPELKMLLSTGMSNPVTLGLDAGGFVEVSKQGNTQKPLVVQAPYSQTHVGQTSG